MTLKDVSSPERSTCKLLKKESKFYTELALNYDLDSCIEWIKTNNFEKVCLQFPESLLIDSVDISAYIENNLKRKVYILGDTAYGSCCADEVAARHIEGDCLVHFGQACLSPVSIPVYYVLPKCQLDVNRLVNTLQNECLPTTPLLILYDVSFYHCITELKKKLIDRDELSQGVCIANLILPHQTLLDDGKVCSTWCYRETGKNICSTTRLQRTYCVPPEGSFKTVLYIGGATPNMYNFLHVIRDVKTFYYSETEGLKEVRSNSVNKQLSYLVEKVRAAQYIGIVVATLGIQGYREALNHAKALCTKAGKKSYILSLGKPNPAKLANFAEIDLYVCISCPEAELGDKKQYLQPICGLYELDLALNSSREWTTPSSKDFRDIINGGCDYVKDENVNEQDNGDSESGLSSSLHILPVESTQLSQTFHHRKTWQGLEQRLGEDSPAVLVQGVSGSPQTSYCHEPKQ